ncbi:universal stress protein [Vibrio panuliri]|uniref:Universal stress protein n=1 Tax=Vibrio panuliri TaxID=1381081 RepID=A0A1Q9HFI9_9VIBR|nr:universal stress protein [Vibrio panuliri]KAB1454802.1 universal stress global response regulator UspA [Vibrio panuliri]OLQ85559.1 universal stress global response regulator UspA [Vibrio panuliri]OLQ88486.1 universal stress global response regulator UspA [Vibrio panuliri]
MKYNHILVALDLSDESKILIDRAVFLAKTVDAQLSFIHVDGNIGEVYPDLIDIAAEPEQRPLNLHAMEYLHEFQDYVDYPLQHFFVGTGDLAAKLKGVTEENQVDLIICGHHHDFISHFISYSRRLLNKATVDILVVPV